MRNLKFLAAAIALIGSGYVLGQQARTPVPHLIAQDCEGAGGDLWAMDESDFPTACAHIEPWR